MKLAACVASCMSPPEWGFLSYERVLLCCVVVRLREVVMWAHSSNSEHRRHRLEDHLRGTAALARRFAEPFGLGGVAEWAGLVHDGGKAWCDWQVKLLRVEGTESRVGLDHKSYGVQLARRYGLRPVEWAVAGHHGGLGSQDDVDGLLGADADEEEARSRQWTDVERMLHPLVPEIFSQVPPLPPDFTTGPGTDRMVGEFALRFLYSCLVDADALDTQAHRLGLDGPWTGADLDASTVLERFLLRRERFLADRREEYQSRQRAVPESADALAMDTLRERVFEAALDAAGHDQRLWRMTAPTGAAKTIAAAGFALRHAALFNKRRVVVAVPFITITEQNAAVYRGLLDDEDPASVPVVLEHHSNVNLDLEAPGHRWHRLAAENWDAPFVVTTTVQLFESLFGRRPSQLRKVHRLANAVIVLDEVQALPHRLLPQVADALRILTTRFGATVLLSSATQPELRALGPLQHLDAPEVVPDVAAVFARSRRVRYQWRVDPKPTLAEVVVEALAHNQVLVVVNTVRDARIAFEQARDGASTGTRVLHLSTGMCPAHRRRVLHEVKTLLKAQHPLCLVSTSLIEAGVDIDVPTVFRAMAPPDSQAQAAGRCNREGRLGSEGGLVVIFDPADGGVPPSYRTQIEKARLYFGPGPDHADPEDLDALRCYFQDLYRTLGVEAPGSVAKTIERHRWRWDFRSVADGPPRRDGNGRDRELAFRLILEDTVPVVVPYGDDDERRMVATALAAMRGPQPDPSAWRRIQPYVTTIRRRTAQTPEIAALTEPVVGDLVAWRGEYDEGFGLVLQPRGEDYIW